MSTIADQPDLGDQGTRVTLMQHLSPEATKTEVEGDLAKKWNVSIATKRDTKRRTAGEREEEKRDKGPGRRKKGEKVPIQRSPDQKMELETRSQLRLLGTRKE